MCIFFEISIKNKKSIFIFFHFSWRKTGFLIFFSIWRNSGFSPCGEKPDNEKEIVNAEFNKCLQEMEAPTQYLYLESIKTICNQIIGHSFDISIISISVPIKYIAKKLDIKCSVASKFKSHEDGIVCRNFEQCKNALVHDFKLLMKNNKRLRRKMSEVSKMGDFILQFNSSYSLTFLQHSEETKEVEKYENILFNNNLKTLFRIRMRSLIILKIILNAIEYFEICHYYLQINKLPLIENLTVKDIPADYEKMIKIKIKEENSGEDLDKEEELLLYKYILYQNFIKSCFVTNTTLFNDLNSLDLLFTKIETEIISFYSEFLSDKIENGNMRKNIFDFLMLEYEEEYFKMATMFEKDFRYLFLRVPTKLKNLVKQKISK